jgi:hypothetical protein
MFSYRRVKNDERDAADLADLLRMGRLPEAWIAPPATRELRELVRHRAKLVALRSSLKCQVHAVLAACGVQVLMSDLFGAGGQALLGRVVLAPAFRARLNSARRVIEALDFEIELFTNLVGGRLRGHPGYTAIQAISGVGGDPGRGVRRRDRRGEPIPPGSAVCWPSLLMTTWRWVGVSVRERWGEPAGGWSCCWCATTT